MSKSKYAIGDRVQLRSPGGNVIRVGSEPVRFRITAIDKVPHAGVWYRLEAKQEMLQSAHGGWYPQARIRPHTPATPKLAAQSALLQRLPSRALLVTPDGTMHTIALGLLIQKAAIRALLGDALTTSPAGEDAVCLARFAPLYLGAPHNKTACEMLAALADTLGGCGSPVGHVHGPALFVGRPQVDGKYGSLPDSALAAIHKLAS
ncbi:hypothetical protein ACQEVX_05410 [Streptomyces syringium]|uniref:hypothetical protein n=1 Tax=Streptomyces syringium TaxID=76729 RepID=UPI003D935F4F